MFVHKQIDNSSYNSFWVKYPINLSANDSGAQLNYGFSGSRGQLYSSFSNAEYTGSSVSWALLKNKYYTPGSEFYLGMNKEGFYSSSVQRYIRIPFVNRGDRIDNESFQLIDNNNLLNLKDDGVGNIIDYGGNKNIIGNIFYREGSIVLWDDTIGTLYTSSCSGSSWTMNYNTKTRVRNFKYTLTVDKSEFNYSQNKSYTKSYGFFESSGSGIYNLENNAGLSSSVLWKHIYSGSEGSELLDTDGSSLTQSLPNPSFDATTFSTSSGLEMITTEDDTRFVTYIREGNSKITGSYNANLFVFKMNFDHLHQLFDTGTPENDAFYLFRKGTFSSDHLKWGIYTADEQEFDVRYAFRLKYNSTILASGLSNTYSGSFNNIKAIDQLSYLVLNDPILSKSDHYFWTNGSASEVHLEGAALPPAYFSSSATESIYQTQLSPSGAGINSYSVASASVKEFSIYGFRESSSVLKDNVKTMLQNEYLYDSGKQAENLSGESFEFRWNSSEYPPYITTIGLFNKQKELVAIAKLSHPIKNEEDTPLRFEISLDY